MIRKRICRMILVLAVPAFVFGTGMAQAANNIVHDAEYYIKEAQNGKKWDVEDQELDKKLAELREKYGAPPNIVHYMWDDQPVMSFGDPIYQKIRGYDTPHLNKLAQEGILFIPTDRVIDGIDQTALLMKGDTSGRRDYNFIYQGPDLAATVKDHYKIHWTSNDPSQAKSGLTAVYDLYNDQREVNPIVVGGFHMKEPFKRMRARHELWKEKYPDRHHKRAPSYTGIANARPETIAISQPPAALKVLPYDFLEFIEQLDKLPYDASGDPGFGE